MHPTFKMNGLISKLKPVYFTKKQQHLKPVLLGKIRTKEELYPTFSRVIILWNGACSLGYSFSSRVHFGFFEWMNRKETLQFNHLTPKVLRIFLKNTWQSEQNTMLHHEVAFFPLPGNATGLVIACIAFLNSWIRCSLLMWSLKSSKQIEFRQLRSKNLLKHSLRYTVNIIASFFAGLLIKYNK